MGRRRSLLAVMILLIVSSCCNVLSAAASSFCLFCSTSYGAAACHIYNDGGSGTAVSSTAGAGAAVATRIIHIHSTVNTHCLLWSCFQGISFGSLFARSISPKYLIFL